MYLPTAATPRPSWPCCTHLAVLLPPPSSASPDGWNNAVRWWPSWPRWVITSSAIRSCARRWRRLWSIWGSLDFCVSIGHYLKEKAESKFAVAKFYFASAFFYFAEAEGRRGLHFLSFWHSRLSSRAKRRISGTSSGCYRAFSLRSTTRLPPFLVV